MPRYELMYILASSVSDDIVPETTKEIEGFVADFGGSEIVQDLLGKKKLSYPIKKTRNGHYGLITFSMMPGKIADLDAKIRTQRNTIIRHIIINIDEHLMKLAKDKEVQAKMNRNRPPEMVAADNVETETKPVVKKVIPKPAAKPVKKVTTESIDEEIEKALTEDII